MITHRMRLRRRLLDTYVRIEREERGGLTTESPAGAHDASPHPRSMPEDGALPAPTRATTAERCDGG
jgi:hypothetical protein